MKNRTLESYIIQKLKENPKEAELYLKEAIKDFENDRELIYLLLAIKDVVKAKGICNIAKETGLTRQGIWNALRPNREPRLSTLVKILNALGYTIYFRELRKNELDKYVEKVKKEKGMNWRKVKHKRVK